MKLVTVSLLTEIPVKARSLPHMHGVLGLLPWVVLLSVSSSLKSHSYMLVLKSLKQEGRGRLMLLWVPDPRGMIR